MALVCAGCNQKQGILAGLNAPLGGAPFYCDACIEKERARQAKIAELAKNVLVTTTPSIDGYRIRKYLGIESVEFVIGTGFFSEITTSVQDFFGQRSTAFEVKLKNAKSYAMAALKFVASEKGANAVVGIDLDFTEFSGNRIGLIINGTLVLAERIEEPSDRLTRTAPGKADR